MSGEDERKLFVAGLADTATEAAVRALFEGTGGSVDELTVPRDRNTGKIRGFAFVTMASEGEARVAREQLDGSLQDGRSISVRAFRADRSAGPGGGGGGGGGPRPMASTPPAEDSTLYVGNLPFSATSAELEQLFKDSGFSEVRRIHLPTDADGRARGFGFVTLDSADSAKNAVDEMLDAQLQGRRLSISVARARGSKPPPPRGGASRPPPPMGGGGGGGGGGGRPPPSYDGPPPSFDGPPMFGGGGGGDADRRSSGRREKRKDKKRKTRGGAGAPSERAPRRKRGGGGDEFRSTRASDYVDDWDDD